MGWVTDHHLPEKIPGYATGDRRPDCCFYETRRFLRADLSTSRFDLHKDRNDDSGFFRFQSNTGRLPGDYTSIRIEKQIDFIQHQSSNVTTATYRVLKFKTDKINNMHATFQVHFSIQ